MLSEPDCLPTPAARCCVAPLRTDPDRFIIGSEDGSLHTVSVYYIFCDFSTKFQSIGLAVFLPAKLCATHDKTKARRGCYSHGE